MQVQQLARAQGAAARVKQVGAEDVHIALRVGAAEYGVQAGELFVRRGLPALKRRAAVARKAEVAAGENPLLRPDAPGVGEVFLYERVGRAGLGGVLNPLHDGALA